MSGQAIVNLGGTAEVFRLLSREIKPKPVFSVDEGLFCFPFPGESQNAKGETTMKTENIPYKIYLSESEMPQNWYNVRADMKNKPAPLVNPGTGKPMGFDDLRPVFCDELIEQELDNDTPYIPIPQEIRDFYKMYRPSPLVRAYCLEEKLGTPAKIYYKFEGSAPEYISRDLRACAEFVAELDEKMLSLNEAIQKEAIQKSEEAEEKKEE